MSLTGFSQRREEHVDQSKQCPGFRAAGVAAGIKKKDALDPFNRYPKEEPFKRYTYHKNKASTNGAIPYATEWPTRKSFDTWAAMTWEDVKFQAITQAAKAVRSLNAGKGDPEIDQYLIETLEEKNFVAF